MQVAGDTLQLQKLELTVPGDAEVTGLTFVARSADNSAWFRDGGVPDTPLLPYIICSPESQCTFVRCALEKNKHIEHTVGSRQPGSTPAGLV